MSEKSPNLYALIIEEDRDLVESLAENLSMLNYKCLACGKPNDAKMMIKNQKFDCIFVGIRRDQSGVEPWIESLRQDPYGFNFRSPIIVMSDGLDANLVKRIATRVNDIVVKPFEMKTFLERAISVVKIPGKMLATAQKEKEESKK
jgi:DNA-binding response OmpR family regulator